MRASFTRASQCVSVCECVCLFACLPGIPDERRISSVPLIWMKGSTAARNKTSFSYFVTLSCKMSLLKSVPELWLPSSVGISPSAGWAQAGNHVWMSESHFNICLDIKKKCSSFNQNRRLQQWWVMYPTLDRVLAQMKFWCWAFSHKGWNQHHTQVLTAPSCFNGNSMLLISVF